MIELKELLPEITALDEKIQQFDNPPVVMMVYQHRARLNNQQAEVNLTSEKFQAAVTIYDDFASLSFSDISSDVARNAFQTEANQRFLKLIKE